MRRQDIFTEWRELLARDEAGEESRKKSKRKPEAKDGPQPDGGSSTDTENADNRRVPSEDEERTVEAVRAFMEKLEKNEERARAMPPPRVELDTAIKRLPAEVQRFIEARISDRTGWHLERRRRLFTWLVRRETRVINDTEVEIDHRLAVRRTEQAYDTEELDRHIERALCNDQEEDAAAELAQAARMLPEGDEVRIKDDVDDDPCEFILRREGVERVPAPQPVQTESPIADAPEPAGDSDPDSAGETVADVRPDEIEYDLPREPLANDPVEAGPDIPPVTAESPSVDLAELPEVADAWYEDAVTEAWQDDARDSVEEHPDPAAPDRESAVGKEPVPGEAPPLDEALEALADQADKLEDLPPVAGGSPELDDERRRRRRTEVVVENRPWTGTPETRPHRRVFLPLSERGEQVAVWESGWTESRAVPGDRLKRSARKLIRLLARRYRIRMTPELEAYLLEIALRPTARGNQRIFSLGANRENLVRTIQVIWLNYNGRFAG